MKYCIPLIISVVAILLALIAVGATKPTIGDLDFDYYGAVLGVISLLVTILMGYQIYTVINVKDELREVQRARAEMDDKLQKKAESLTVEYKEELKQATPLILAMSSTNKTLIEAAVFKAYKECKSGQLAKDLARQSIITIFTGIASSDDEKRHREIAEMAQNVQYDEVVEFYTDFAKDNGDSGFPGITPLLLELLGELTTKH